MVWPKNSWVFSRFLEDKIIKLLASIFCVLATIGFVAGGIGILVSQVWWHPVVMGSAIFSAIIFILFWDGELQKLHDKGGVGLLINVAILSVALIL